MLGENPAPTTSPDADRDHGMRAIECDNLIFRYGTKQVLNTVSLDVAPGEMFGLLGPSGCGKTTTLNVVAGFITPEAGTVRLDGREVTRTPPERRDTAMVFQSYALFPHLSVTQNIAFGLRYKKLPKTQLRSRVAETLQLVNMTEYGDRYPRQLSGGQQQRVALARAVAVRPKVLLLDEPLSNLDAGLRTRMRGELVDIQRATGIAALFVTHDQEEAMAVCDRIAVMRDGAVEQVGTPQQLYEQPGSPFVAGFLGPANFITGTATSTHEETITAQCRADTPLRGRPVGTIRVGDPVRVMVRPAHVRIGPAADPVANPAGPAVNRMDGAVRRVVYLGDRHDIVIDCQGSPVQAHVPAGVPVPIGPVASPVQPWWPVDDTLIFPAEEV